MLTVTTPGVLLPTIRSRTRVLPLSPLNASDMRTLLSGTAATLSPEDTEAIVGLSGGSIGFALKMIRSGALPLYRDMLALLDGLPHMDVAALHQLADQISRKADAESYDVLKTLLIDRLREKAHQEAHRFPQGRPDLALNIWEKTKETLIAADVSSLDRKAAFITAICDIRNNGILSRSGA